MPSRRVLTGRRQRDGVSGGVAVEGRFDNFDAQAGVHTQKIGNKTSNVWGSHRRSGDNVGARTDPTIAISHGPNSTSVSVNTDQVDQTSTPVKERFQRRVSLKWADGRALTRSDNVNEGAVVREVGEVVVNVRSSDGDGSRSASGREEFGILSEVSGLNRCQGSIDGLLIDLTTNQQRWWEHRKQPAVQTVSGRFRE